MSRLTVTGVNRRLLLASGPFFYGNFVPMIQEEQKRYGPEVIKRFSCSTQLRLKFILLINVKMPTKTSNSMFYNSQNAMRAVVETHMQKEKELPALKLKICKGVEDLTIKV